MEINDLFSIETLPDQSARAAFVTKTSEVFRESGEISTRITPKEGYEYVSWGEDDLMPYNIIDLIEQDETLSTCQIFNAEVCYGAGLRYCTAEASVATRRQVEQFLLDNPMPDYYLGVCQDIKHFSFAVSVIVLNADGSRIVELHRKRACYCRFAKADASGRIPYVVYGPFRNTQPGDQFERIELLDPRSPWKDLECRLGRRHRRGSAQASSTRKFAILTRFPGVDSLYYPIPHYAALFRGPWYNIKRLIGEAKLSKLQNAVPIRYVVEVSNTYWERLCRDRNVVGREAQANLVKEKKQEILEFFTDTKNAGLVLFTGKSLSLDGKGENAEITVTSIDSRTKEGGDWESDIAEAVNMECFTMRVHSNLVGSVPGKTQTNNSGSDKRELYTIAQALQKPYHDVLFSVHDLIIRFNGWKGVHPDCPFIQLTTLDQHVDAQTVTTNTPDNATD